MIMMMVMTVRTMMMATAMMMIRMIRMMMVTGRIVQDVQRSGG